MNRTVSELMEEANARAKKAEHDRVLAFREKSVLMVEHASEISSAYRQVTALRLELATARQTLHEKEVDTHEKRATIMRLKHELEEKDAEVEKLKNRDAKEMEDKYAAAKLAVEDMKLKLEEMKADNEKVLAVYKKKLEEAEAQKEKDSEYAEMKQQLSTAKIRRGVDERLISSAYSQIVQLNRELELAKIMATPKNGEEAESGDPKDHLKGCSPQLISKIESDIIDRCSVTMDDIAGLESAKKCVNELIVWPMSRPDLFTGLRALPRGLLLFGPPGTGKTMIGKAIANQSGATFFYISASSIMSKWAGESEQLVRTLFAVAAAKQPSVIFIDEIDSMLTKRSDGEPGHQRSIKTEFMVQLDGMSSKTNDSVLIIGATNCPHTLDEAIRRRFVKRMYIPLPATDARAGFLQHALRDSKHELADDDFKRVAESTDGFSCADMQALCTEAALGPVREVTDIRNVEAADIRAIQHEDFVQALANMKSSVSSNDLKLFEDWNAEFGSFPVS